MKDSQTKYQLAATKEEFEIAAGLFREYARQISIDLSFQNFEEELKMLPIQYNKPVGGLLLAKIDDQYAACVGIRKLDEQTAELKRMYVRQQFRGYGIGVKLLERAIELAAGLGYRKIRLDTLAQMTRAQALYQSFGFYTIAPYRYNPIEGTVYMEKLL